MSMYAGLVVLATPMSDPHDGNIGKVPCCVEVLWLTEGQLNALDAVGPQTEQGQDLVCDWLSAEDSGSALLITTMAGVPEVARTAGEIGVDIGLVDDFDFPVIMGCSVQAPATEGDTDDWREWLVPDVAAVVDGDDDGNMEFNVPWPDSVDDLPEVDDDPIV